MENKPFEMLLAPVGNAELVLPPIAWAMHRLNLETAVGGRMIGVSAALDGAELERNPWLFHALSEAQARHAKTTEGRASRAA